MRFSTSKKGVEPLIAAVLLIVVVVGIGAVVTGIVRNYVTENKQTITEKASDMKCGVEVNMVVPTVADVLKVCKSTDGLTLNFTLENTGTATIDQLQVKWFGDSNFGNNDTVLTTANAGADGFIPGETVQFNGITTATAIGTLQQVKIVPRVKVVGRSEYAYCTDAALTFTDIRTCP